MLKFIKILRIFVLTLLSFTVQGQAEDSTLSYEYAKMLAFNGDLQRATFVCNKILSQNSNDNDTRLLLANVYAWSKKFDSSKVELDYLLIRQPSNEEALLAYGNVELWSGNIDAAFVRVNIGLSFYENSKAFLLQKAKILEVKEQYRDALKIVDSLVILEPENKEFNDYWAVLKIKSKQHRAGVFYLYEYLDANYLRSAHVFGAELAIKTKFGFIIPRFNVGQIAKTRYEYLKNKSYQLEIDCYPKLTEHDYLYINYGYADTTEILFFPTHRAGLEWFRKLPHKFEVSIGGRYLYYNEAVFLYTFSVSKYLNRFWFSIRPFVSVANSDGISNSFVFTTRFYFRGSDDYVSLMFHSGYSPDNGTYTNGSVFSTDLQKYAVSAGFQKRIQLFLFKYNAGIGRIEYAASKYGVLWNMDATISYYF